MALAIQLEFVEQYTTKAMNGHDIICDLRIYQNENGKIIVIVSELIDDLGNYMPSVSVTNGAEDLATAVRKMGYDFDCWIEHYPDRGHPLSRIREEFSIVTMQYKQTYIHGGQRRDYHRPEWKHVVREIVEQMIGQDLDLPESTGGGW